MVPARSDIVLYVKLHRIVSARFNDVWHAPRALELLKIEGVLNVPLRFEKLAFKSESISVVLALDWS